MTNTSATVLVPLKGLQRLEEEKESYRRKLKEYEKEPSNLEYLIDIGANRAYYINIAGIPEVVEERNLSASAITSAVFDQGIFNFATDLFAELLGILDGGLTYYRSKRKIRYNQKKI
ncbi:MAG: hypothetical protein ACE5J4_03455 [Candidatus Aenigmatarchaeota archaeon]